MMMAAEKPDRLYHYCNLDAFINIIKNKTIRLSDVGKSNDYMESKWLLMNSLEKEVLRQYEENPFLVSDRVIYGLNDIDTIKYFVQLEKRKVIDRSDQVFYAACFSQQGDLLSQWRGYGDDGRGVSIGFNFEVLKSLTEENSVLNLQKVIYPCTEADNGEKLLLIEKYAEKFLDCLYTLINEERTKDIYFNGTTSDTFFSWMTRDFFQKSIIYKNPAFSQEEEWRIIYASDMCDKEDPDWSLWHDKQITESGGYLSDYFLDGLNFRSLDDKIISYLDLTFEKEMNDIIDKIIIGPKCKLDKGDISQLLSCYQYFLQDDIDDIVSKSAASYQ